MPSSPGSRLLIIEAQAGTVMGGWVLSSVHRRQSSSGAAGSSSRHCSNTSCGAAQSKPITRSFKQTSLQKRMFVT
jgi:hypothetical protein